MGLFFKDKPKVETRPQAKQSTASPSFSGPNGFMGTGITVATSATDITGEDFSKHLDGIMEAANIAGPDFYEFSKALAGIAGQPLTEGQKYITTFAAFSAMGITPQKLIEAAQFYIKKLEEERVTFGKELISARKAKVDDKKDEVQRLTNRNAELARETEENSTKINALNQSIITNIAKLTSNEMSFNQACDIRIQGITNQITNIKTYLTDGQSTK